MEAIGVVLALVVAGIVWLVNIANRQKAKREKRAAVEVADLPKYKASYRDLDIVGESYRQGALERLWDSSGGNTRNAIMIPEANNPHDKNAVRVEIEGLHVAYLSRETAKEYRHYMGTSRCAIPVHLVKGGPEGTIGVFTGIKH